MARCRRSSLSILWMILHLTLVSGHTMELDNTRRGATIGYQSKRQSRKRKLSSSGKGKGSKRSSNNNVWYRGFYSHSTQSSHSSSRSESYDIQIQVLFPNKPDQSGSQDETPQPSTQPQTLSPTRLPTKLPTKSPTRQPTSSPTSEPSIRPTKRPTASPSQNPTSLSSESPTIFVPSQNPSANPSAIASDSPTLSPAPSSSPSSAPSALSSNGPSATMFPSHSPTSARSGTPSITPSVLPSGSPSMVPSVSPSAIDSDQPTRSLSPSLAPSALPSSIGSSSPSASANPSAVPTMTRSEGPSSIPSMTPSMVPSSDPSIGPSTTPPFETAAPAIPGDAQNLPAFTLEYQLFDFEDPTESDLVELEALTRAYLRDHIFGAVDDADALLDDFFTTYTDVQTDSGALVINVSFESTAFYNPSSPATISMNDLTEEVVNAFTGEELDEYMERVQSLPNSNTFAGSIQVFLISQLESANQRSLISVLLSGSAALLSILGGFGLIQHRRRKSGRRQASKKFLEMISKDSATDCSSIQGDFKDSKTDSSVLSMQGHNSNPFENSDGFGDKSEGDDFLHVKRSKYSRPRMHKFSDD